MPYSRHHVQPPLKFIPQAFNPIVLQITRWLLPFLLRFRTRRWVRGGITRIETANVEILVDLYRQFQARKIRFLLAFRHPEVEDPLCMLYLLSRAVPKVARQQNISLQHPIHSHFIYDRGILLWAGAWSGWLLSRLGGISIHRGRRLDRIPIQTARDLLVNAKLPLAVAPEGATNGHSEIVSPLEPGVAQLGFWGVEDLAKAGRSEAVLIVPISIQYHYVTPPWKSLDKLLSQLEADSGLPVQQSDQFGVNDQQKVLYQRLLRLGEHLLEQMEQFYTRFYHRNIPKPTLPTTEALPCANQVLVARLQVLLDVALQVTEEYFHLPKKGSIIERCRRVEEAGWNYIYREDLKNLESLSSLKHGLADWVAEEASLRMKHMRLVESFVAVTGNYILEKPTAERFAEVALLMFDLIARIKSNLPPRRPQLGKRWVQITVGEPISVTERWQTAQASRQAARHAVAKLTQDLQQAMEKLIS